MRDSNLAEVFADLFEWCRKHNFSGYDPFDALNSRVFQATPFRHSPIARLAWTQLFKRSPLNLRALALVPAQTNPKGTALFALAALANYRRLRTKEAEIAARELIDDLLAMQLSGWNGAAWAIACPGGIPRSCRCRQNETSTRPFKTATPKSAMPGRTQSNLVSPQRNNAALLAA